VISEIQDASPGDPIARRLRDLGFVAGEPVRVVARGPLGGDPYLVQIGFTRFALRGSEAGRVLVTPEAPS
jgi:ferrous iron transport protein A